MTPRIYTDSEEAQIAKIYLAGHSARAIARAYGKSHHISIVAALRRQGIKQRSPAERNRLYSLNPHAFDKIDNEQKAYWLGFLYADGCTHKRSLQVALKREDKKQLVKLKAFLESEAPIKDTLVGNGFNDKKHKQAFFLVTDKHLINKLRSLGVIANRPDHSPMTSNTPARLYGHLIRGYFDGDGSARKSQTLAFCGSKPLLTWIRNTVALHANTNPNLAITPHTTANLHYLYFGSRKVSLKVADFMYQNATVWLSRKRQRIDSWRK